MLRRLARTAADVVVRVYAFVIFLVVVWVTYAGVAYLIRSVFYPTRVPERFVQWQGRLRVADLRGRNAANRNGATQRAPLGHYHGVDYLFQFDPTNDCTGSGCHSPLPHRQTVERRAFGNFHATFLRCRTCHEPLDVRPAAVQWVSTATGKPEGPPPILRLLAYLQDEAARSQQDAEQVHPTIIKLLRETVNTVGDDPMLNYLLLQIRTAEPGSPVWTYAVEQLAAELPGHARGHYGAKMAPKTPVATGDEDQMHAALSGARARCLDCHTEQDSLLDLEALGYTPSRAETLRSLLLARMVEQAQQDGQPFRIRGGGD